MKKGDFVHLVRIGHGTILTIEVLNYDSDSRVITSVDDRHFFVNDYLFIHDDDISPDELNNLRWALRTIYHCNDKIDEYTEMKEYEIANIDMTPFQSYKWEFD